MPKQQHREQQPKQVPKQQSPEQPKKQVPAHNQVPKPPKQQQQSEEQQKPKAKLQQQQQQQPQRQEQQQPEQRQKPKQVAKGASPSTLYPVDTDPDPGYIEDARDFYYRVPLSLPLNEARRKINMYVDKKAVLDRMKRFETEHKRLLAERIANGGGENDPIPGWDLSESPIFGFQNTETKEQEKEDSVQQQQQQQKQQQPKKESAGRSKGDSRGTVKRDKEDPPLVLPKIVAPTLNPRSAGDKKHADSQNKESKPNRKGARR